MFERMNPSIAIQIFLTFTMGFCLSAISPNAVSAQTDPVTEKYLAAGGSTVMGEPHSAQPIPTGDGGLKQYYGISGAIFWSARTNAHITHGAIQGKYAEIGEEMSYLGYPTTDESWADDHTGMYNDFEKGSIYWHSDPSLGAHILITPIRDKWKQLGGETGFLGYPRTDSIAMGDGGYYVEFQYGMIWWHPDRGAFELHGAIWNKFVEITVGMDGYNLSLTGYPTTDETVTPDGIGRYNHFDHVSIYWSPLTNAHVIYGSIRDKWSELGWEKGILGYPTTDELSTQDGKGRVSHFEKGSIYWNSNTGVTVSERQRACYNIQLNQLSLTNKDYSFLVKYPNSWSSGSSAIELIPLHIRGDLDFKGHGPKYIVRVAPLLTPDKLSVHIYMRAWETNNDGSDREDYTTVEGETKITALSVTDSWYIKNFNYKDDIIPGTVIKLEPTISGVGSDNPFSVDIEELDPDGHSPTFKAFKNQEGITTRPYTLSIVGDTDGNEAGTRTGVDVHMGGALGWVEVCPKQSEVPPSPDLRLFLPTISGS